MMACSTFATEALSSYGLVLSCKYVLVVLLLHISCEVVTWFSFMPLLIPDAATCQLEAL